MADLTKIDPAGLIREAYNIEGLTLEEARSIFFDWAIGHRKDSDGDEDLKTLLTVYGADAPDHPMTGVLREGVGATPAKPTRRGGARARRG